MSDDSTRPISVAELLARNGTIGAPPVSGRRRRRRGNSAAVTVAELTGEIPVIRVDEPPVAQSEEPEEQQESWEYAEYEAEEYVAEEYVAEEYVAEEYVAAEVTAEEYVAEEYVAAEVTAEPVDAATVVVYAQPEPILPEPIRPEPIPVAAPPPLAADPLPRRERGPTLSHDPRPLRRVSGAEQMTYDPVYDPEDSGLIDEPAEDVDELRSYLHSTGGELFGGDTVADDLVRRGAEPDFVVAAGAVSRADALRNGVVAVLQSVLAVLLGAGLFIGFDQLWRWNNIVALVLSVLVILGLVVAVRLVRKTEDIASTLTAVAVGALVTLGPLALLQST
jgi:hypothetical protein